MNKPKQFPSGDTAISLQGPAGNLEALTSTPDNDSNKGVAIVCHPNPLQEGTMNNKVVYMITRTLHGLGFKTVRFNYRGVGKSAGHYGHTEGETEDLLAVMDWVDQTCPQQILYLAGFSFGSFISANAANRRPERASQLISVAPAVEQHNFFLLKNITCPWLVIQGDQDDVADADATADWVRRMLPQPELVIVPGAGHFFHGRLLDLRHVLEMELGRFGPV